ncbi:hypothetical protein EMMF5_003700 [Cystobasidiomycetes sp. EMM_F5]
MSGLPTEPRRRVFVGDFVHSLTKRKLEYLYETAVGVDEFGVIVFIEPCKQPGSLELILERLHWTEAEIVELVRGEFIIPGMLRNTREVAAWNIGRGQQFQLLDWLSNFRDVRYAERTYKSVVKRVIASGTTCCCWYGTLHLDATKILADIVHRSGQRSFVGKCNMDRHSAPDYTEKSASASIADTKEFVNYVRKECAAPLYPKLASGPISPTSNEAGTMSPNGMRGSFSSPRKRSTTSDSSASSSSSTTSESLAVQRSSVTSLVQPIITPRFAISCSDALMAGLQAVVGKDPTLHIQTHLAENPAEIEFTKQLFPFTDSYTHVYDHFGLLSQKTILAHCVHLEEHEMDLIQQRGAGISHCPTSNLNLRSGNSPVAVLLDRNIKVGLGTDVSGGFGHGILSALREASVVSKVLSFTQEKKTEKDKSRGRSETPKGGLPVIEGDKHLAAASEVSETEMFTGKHLPLETLFFLATLGGAEVCDLQDRIGNFVVGKEFDAILVRTGQANPDDEGDVFFSQPNPAMFVEPEDTLPVLFERFLFTGDYANIASVFVRGRTIGGAAPLK